MSEATALLRLQHLRRNLDQQLKSLVQEKSDADLVQAAFALVQDYDCLAGETYRLRSSQVQDTALDHAEDLLATVGHELVQLTSDENPEPAYQTFIGRYRRIWRQNLTLFIFTFFIFVSSSFVGWSIGVREPDYLPLIVGQEMMENVLNKEAWFERLEKNPLMGGFEIAINNIKVAISCFFFGCLLGIGGIYILVFNGLLFGGLLGYCSSHQFEEPLLSFVMGHGPLELTIIIASAFASFTLGRVFYMRPFRLLKLRLGHAAEEAAVLMMGIVPWLLLAASIEAFISPSRQIPVNFKIGLGILVTLMFWLWSLWPAKSQT